MLFRSRVRVRITAISLGRTGGSAKIGVTARQPFLGKLEWIGQELHKTEEAAEKKQEKKGDEE